MNMRLLRTFALLLVALLFVVSGFAGHTAFQLYSKQGPDMRINAWLLTGTSISQFLFGSFLYWAWFDRRRALFKVTMPAER
jgi:hypothetical protein